MDPTLQAQLKAQQDMMDAIATGNREKFAEAQAEFNAAQRLRYSELFGYDTGAGSGSASGTGGGGAGTGSYNTANGPKTIDQMRSELKAAGWPGPYDNEASIISTYASTTKGPVTAGGAGGSSSGGPGGPNVPLAQQIKAAYAAAVAKKRPGGYLPPNDPDAINAVAQATGLSPQDAQAALQRGHDYYAAIGKEIPDDVLAHGFDAAMPYGQHPTLDTQKFLEGKRQFDASQYSDFAKSLLSAATNLRGPRDYASYQQMLGGGKNLLEQLSGNQPQPAFGITGTPEPANIKDILDSLGLTNWQPKMSGQAAA